MNSLPITPNFIIWTGDTPPHYLDFNFVEQYTPEMVLGNINFTTQLILKYFPKTPVYPCLGNHDNYLSDQLAPPPTGQAWLKKIGSMWAQWLPSEALASFEYGGYYTVNLSIK